MNKASIQTLASKMPQKVIYDQRDISENILQWLLKGRKIYASIIGVNYFLDWGNMKY